MLHSLGLDSVRFSERMFGGSWVMRAVMFFSALLLSQVQPAAGLAPFALAMFAAAMAANACPAAILAGCLGGMLSRSGFQLAVPVGLAVAALGAVAVQGLGKRRAERRDEKYCGQGDVSASVLAGLGVVIPGLQAAAGGAWESLRVLTAAALAAASAPFFRAWLGVKLTRRHLMPEERAGLMIFACAALAGMAGIWTPLAMTAAMAGVLVVSALGAGAAACAGLACGATLMLMGLEPVRAAALGVCGMLAGLAPPRKRWLPPVLMLGGTTAAFLTLGVSWIDPLCAMAAAAAYLALPEEWARRGRLWLAGETRGVCDPDRLAMRLRAESEKRLRAMSDAFGELSDGYRIGVDVPDEQTLIAQMRDRLCGECPYYVECWAGDDNRAVRFLCQLISQAIDWANGDCAEPLFDDELPPDLLRQCRRGKSIPVRVGGLLEEFAQKRRSEMKRSAVNQLISAQFMQAQMLLRGLADAQSRPLKIRGRQAARAQAALDQAGIRTAEVMALRGMRQMEIVATLQEGRWSPELAAEAARRLTCTFGKGYAPADGVGGTEMKFVRLPRLKASASASCHSRQAGAPCGDSHMIRALDGDRMLLMISDGMGSGEAAARESAQTLRLLGQFLAADVPRSLALETVNELMLARTDSDMFATVDMCLIDLSSGVAEFTKLAACRSLILRREEVLTVEGGRLPLGILEGVRPSVMRVQLEPGDVVVLASDGVVDAMSHEEMCECLFEHAYQPPERMAEAIVRRAERRVETDRRDDMTALCARVLLRREAC